MSRPAAAAVAAAPDAWEAAVETARASRDQARRAETARRHRIESEDEEDEEDDTAESESGVEDASDRSSQASQHTVEEDDEGRSLTDDEERRQREEDQDPVGTAQRRLQAAAEQERARVAQEREAALGNVLRIDLSKQSPQVREKMRCARCATQADPRGGLAVLPCGHVTHLRCAVLMHAESRDACPRCEDVQRLQRRRPDAWTVHARERPAAANPIDWGHSRALRDQLRLRLQLMEALRQGMWDAERVRERSPGGSDSGRVGSD